MWNRVEIGPKGIRFIFQLRGSLVGHCRVVVFVASVDNFKIGGQQSLDRVQDLALGEIDQVVMPNSNLI